MIILAGISALCFGFSVGCMIAYGVRRHRGETFDRRVIEGLAEEHAQFVVGMLIALQSIEVSDQPRTEARHTRELIELTITKEYDL